MKGKNHRSSRNLDFSPVSVESFRSKTSLKFKLIQKNKLFRFKKPPSRSGVESHGPIKYHLNLYNILNGHTKLHTDLPTAMAGTASLWWFIWSEAVVMYNANISCFFRLWSVELLSVPKRDSNFSVCVSSKCENLLDIQLTQVIELE